MVSYIVYSTLLVNACIAFANMFAMKLSFEIILLVKKEFLMEKDVQKEF